MKLITISPVQLKSPINVVLTAWVSGILLPMSLAAQSLLNDQIAGHFDQIFSSDTRVRKDESWLPGDDPNDNPLGTEWSFRADGTWLSPSGFEGVSGEIQVAHFQTAASVIVPVKSADSVTLLLTTSDYYMDESPDAEAGPVYDFDHISEEVFGAMYTKNLTPDWDIMIGAGMIHSDGNGSNHVEDYGSFLFLGALNRLTPNFKIGWGSMFSTGYYDGMGTFPTLILDWIINERSRLTLRDGLDYSYALTADWKHSISCGVDVEALSVRLDEYTHKGKSLKEPYLSVMDVAINFGYRLRLSSGFLLEANLGLIHVNNHMIIDKDDDVADTDFEVAQGFSLGMSYQF